MTNVTMTMITTMMTMMIVIMMAMAGGHLSDDHAEAAHEEHGVWGEGGRPAVQAVQAPV